MTQMTMHLTKYRELRGVSFSCAKNPEVWEYWKISLPPFRYYNLFRQCGFRTTDGKFSTSGGSNYQYK